MINFLLDLISNLIILAVLLTSCCVINWMRPDAKPNGYLVFVVFVAIALLFDAALTFLAFADSQALWQVQHRASVHSAPCRLCDGMRHRHRAVAHAQPQGSRARRRAHRHPNVAFRQLTTIGADVLRREYVLLRAAPSPITVDDCKRRQQRRRFSHIGQPARSSRSPYG
ncbi:hypothetical protein [Paraburkholderia hospita]|uniref:hypothetical protein n=1 Tax=Paraburkholderia hospita TaxID=169430 RepID=UPI001F60A895|nr:hypothetical protein [Paraburkholderia hospita]